MFEGIKVDEVPLVVDDKFCDTVGAGFPFEKLTYPLFGADISC